MGLKEVRLEKIEACSKVKLENMISLYLHDLSEFADDLKVNEDGRFEYNGLQLYLELEELMPYFITYDGETAGFVLLNSGRYVPKNIDYVVNELFILKKFRKKGIAGKVVRALLSEHKGKYKIVQISSNKTAVSFWRKFYERQGIEYVDCEEIVDGIVCSAQTFNI